MQSSEGMDNDIMRVSFPEIVFCREADKNAGRSELSYDRDIQLQ